MRVIGLGFADFGAKVGFFFDPEDAAGGGSVIFTPATLVFGAFRGRMLTCQTPRRPVNASGTARLRVSLNGLNAGLSLAELPFLYEDPFEDQEAGSGDTASGDTASGDTASGDTASGEAASGDTASGDTASG